jgi:hypothetical protein
MICGATVTICKHGKPQVFLHAMIVRVLVRRILDLSSVEEFARVAVLVKTLCFTERRFLTFCNIIA